MISVVIPLYNKENYIVTTLKSVLAQTYSDFEVIVVDDGSGDKSVEAALSTGDSRVRVVSKTNGGVSSARNRGIDEARSRYVALLDGDDIWEPEFLSEMNKLINDFPEASLWGCTWAFIREDGSRHVSDYSIPTGFRAYVENYFITGIENTLFNSSSVVIDKEAFNELGRFDESLTTGEDIDLWFRFALKKRLAYINRCMSYYILGAENRASKVIRSREGCLIWNLDRFREDEKNNPDFKRFLDSWRFAHIINFFRGTRSEVNEITPILNQIDLTRYPVFWRILKPLPKWGQLLLFRTRENYQKLFREKKSG
jgi:glycosyltransferase involved in cell wall biosynthesis